MVTALRPRCHRLGPCPCCLLGLRPPPSPWPLPCCRVSAAGLVLPPTAVASYGLRPRCLPNFLLPITTAVALYAAFALVVASPYNLAGRSLGETAARNHSKPRKPPRPKGRLRSTFFAVFAFALRVLLPGLTFVAISLLACLALAVVATLSRLPCLCRRRRLSLGDRSTFSTAAAKSSTAAPAPPSEPSCPTSRGGSASIPPTPLRCTR